MSGFDLSGRVALVTGACGGIGRALCHGLARHGAAVVAVDHPSQDPAALAAALADAGHRAVALTGDLADPQVPDRLVRAALDAFGRVDVLVNNAGVNNKAPLGENVPEAWHEMLAVNVLAAFLLARAAAAAQRAAGLGLSVVNVSSVAGSSALGRGNAGFGVSKAGLQELTRELAVEWASSGVRVNAVQPCQVDGPAFERLAETEDGRRLIAEMLRGIPIGRFAAPEELVGPVVFLASDASSMVTGTVIPVDGGNLALNPGGTIG
ncbi:SDR family NAD(P)-dependent oxidoreductase [Conexibacter sp. CPCC 206217]|uniref:SDR family NAD(P)-dependent oxidoreductase n=1 Tax=Conexibacter sp. CPCC 206217 TaxID=3064574 RepID=UPI00271E64DC|nr:SDR family oxidoreductase [Conexibacter sp. CPCC 206217]MDO8210324.1 SDR family oxidoreductase [Conexibacter sp. CPCC 206217]